MPPCCLIGYFLRNGGFGRRFTLCSVLPFLADSTHSQCKPLYFQLNGEELVLNLRGIGLRHGKFGIYHRCEGPDEDKIIFSAASLVEPGTFDMKTIKEQEIPGISLFMVLPGPVDGAQAFDLMMGAARALKTTPAEARRSFSWARRG